MVVEGGGGGQSGEMTQTMYAHVNKRIKQNKTKPNPTNFQN
jgi:hypothetical protein